MCSFSRPSYGEETRRGAGFIHLELKVELSLPEQFRGQETPSPQHCLVLVLSSSLLNLFLNSRDSFGLIRTSHHLNLEVRLCLSWSENFSWLLSKGSLLVPPQPFSLTMSHGHYLGMWRLSPTSAQLNIYFKVKVSLRDVACIFAFCFSSSW